MTAPVKEGGPDLDAGLLRSTASITIGNVASRVTGFVRVLAVGAALGTTFLGNTYQTSNLVSNILFELLAAGLLSSVLVPTFVGLVDDGRRDDAGRAPVANNVVVIATMAVFWVLHGSHRGLDLSLGERLVLAIGTTVGVVTMTAVPLVAAWRAGLRLRPRWNPRNPAVRALARPGAWAAGYLALNQLLIAVTLVLANRVAGGVVAYQIAYTFFLLPYAVLAQPIMTTLFPRLSSA